MSSPETLLETSDDQAALSRFFYARMLQNDAPTDASDTHTSVGWLFSSYFYDRYKDVLPHPVSLIGSVICNEAGVITDPDQACDDAHMRLTTVFDTSEQTAGRYSWQIQAVQVPERQLRLTTNVRRLSIILLATPAVTIAGYRLVDHQGRPLAGLGIHAADGRFDPAEGVQIVRSLTPFDGIDSVANDYRASKREQALKLCEAEMTAPDQERYLASKERKQLLIQLAQTGFAAAYRGVGHTVLFSGVCG